MEAWPLLSFQSYRSKPRHQCPQAFDSNVIDQEWNTLAGRRTSTPVSDPPVEFDAASMRNKYQVNISRKRTVVEACETLELQDYVSEDGGGLQEHVEVSADSSDCTMIIP